MAEPHVMNVKQELQALSALPSPMIRVAQYVRASTENQNYSTSHQIDALRCYADARGMDIVRTYVDDGRSGLDLKGRPGLCALLDDVLDGRADFEMLLVFDVSRWGRFQDADESAYYEFLCRRAGVRIVYCAELFSDDGSALSGILKALKRAMAAEYSRELSVRTTQARRRFAERGFHQGAFRGLGLRRMVVDRDGQPKAELPDGDRKGHPTDRIVLTPGPPDEVALVLRIFHLFVVERLTDLEIARRLNDEAVPSARGGQWRRMTVRLLLMNERYIGSNVFNKSSQTLRQKRKPIPSELWTRCPGAWPGIVPSDLFQRAQAVRRERARGLTYEDFLEPLKALWLREGYLSAKLIDAQPDMFSSHAYDWRFSGLVNAYRRIGYSSTRDYRRGAVWDLAKEITRDRLLGLLKALLERHGHLSQAMIDLDPEMPSARCYQYQFGNLKQAYALVGYEGRRGRRPAKPRPSRF